MKQRAPYGSWVSPITADALVSRRVKLREPIADCRHVYWLEERPQEGGRTVVVKSLADRSPVDCVPPPYNARTRVHEYGGGAYLPVGDTLYFSNFSDQRLYRSVGGCGPEPITPPSPMRYADYVWDAVRGRLIAVREDHTGAGVPPINTIVALNPEENASGEVLASGNDFYSSPRMNPAGTQLAWLTWNHPNMPWDGTELWLAEWDEAGQLANPRCIAGGTTESITEPQWSPEGVLHFVSDRTGFWNLYGYDPDQGVVPVWRKAAEFGGPAWAFRQSLYVFAWGGIVAAYSEQGTMHLVHLPRGGEARSIPLPYTSMHGLVVEGVNAGPAETESVIMIAASATEAPAIVAIAADGRITRLKASEEEALEPGSMSLAEPIAFPTGQGDTAYGYFYPPASRNFAPMDALERPPLLVFAHGGPTGSASSDFNLAVQYWTSRGFAVVDVNYRGSTGYGRTYRQALLGHWGEYDVEDALSAVEYLVDQGRVDAKRLAIRGGSAGGFTVLAALTFSDTFQAGASYFGISDLQALVEDTHKFESHYTDRLVGPWPEAAAIYRARSPLFHVEQLNTPVILFQGLEDRVVPPNQAEAIVEALVKRGVPVAYLPFEGEGHGFKKEDSIRRAQEAEYAFYARILGFPLPAPVDPPLRIWNLDPPGKA